MSIGFACVEKITELRVHLRKIGNILTNRKILCGVLERFLWEVLGKNSLGVLGKISSGVPRKISLEGSRGFR